MNDIGDRLSYEVSDGDARRVTNDLPEVTVPGANARFFGILDLVAPTLIEGWIYDSAHPNAPVELLVYVDGALIWRGLADLPRADLAALGLGDGRHAFRLKPEAAAFASGVAEHTVSVRIAAYGVDLPLSPRTILLPETTAVTETISGVVDVSSADGSLGEVDIFRRSPLFAGCVDSVAASQIRGWAFDHAAPSIPVSVDIFVSNRLLARITADAYRADLDQHGIGSGCHGFALPTPACLLDGSSHLVRVFVSNTTRELSGSPAAVRFDQSATQQTAAQLRSAIFSSMRTLNDLRCLVEPLADPPHRGSPAGRDAYQAWWRRFGHIDESTREQLRAMLHSTTKFPKFSIIMATFNPSDSMLTEAVASVIGQLYPHWELCIADDRSDKRTRMRLTEFARTDGRIKVRFRSENGHISRAMNSAIEMATGDYLCFLDHDDVLTEDALLRFALTVTQTGADIIYSDEDKIDPDGNLVDPHFKPEFNYSLMLSYNYMCHFLAVRRSVAASVGPFRSEYDGSQDHDFLLRCLETVPPSAIRHLPFVLYHWRSHPLSTASSIGPKSYALDAGIRAITDHLGRTEPRASVSLGKHNAYRVKWPAPQPAPLVSIVIPTRDQHEILGSCVDSLLGLTTWPNLEIIIIDNQSQEPATFRLFDRLAATPRIRIVSYDHPFNFSAICNFGARLSHGEFLLMLNNDVEILEADWLDEMVSQCARPGIGAVGARLLYPDGRLQHAGVILGVGGVAGHSHKFLGRDETGYMNRPNIVQEMSACTAACLLIRASAFAAVGGFDEANLPVAFNDVDLCLRLAEAGFRTVYSPYATLRHHESVSRGSDEASQEKLARANKEKDYMRERWGERLVSDPAYSPNLTLHYEDFSIDENRGVSRVAKA